MVKKDIKCSIFIPCFQIDKKRKRNLEFIYKRLLEHEFHVVLAVQGEYDEYYNKFTNAEVKFFYKKGIFNKSFILNHCLELVKNDFFVFLDIDLYFSFDALKNINAYDEVVKPFSECTYLTEELTQEFINNRSIKIPINAKKVSTLGGGSLIIRSDLIKSKNISFDERFTGWGWEDIDFGDQIRSKGLKVRTLDQPAVHLYHEPSLPAVENANYYSLKTKEKSNIVHVFSAQTQDKESIRSFLDSKNEEVLLVNCDSIDRLNNDNIKFLFLEDNKTAETKSLLNLALPYCHTESWILCTKNPFRVSKDFYLNLSASKEDFISFGVDNFALRNVDWRKENKRTVYFLVSPPRTGTTSICKMAEMCGLKPVHSLTNDNLNTYLKQGYDFFANTPFYIPEYLFGAIQFAKNEFEIKFVYSQREYTIWRTSVDNLLKKWDYRKSTFIDKLCWNYINENYETIISHYDYISEIANLYGIEMLTYDFSQGWDPFCSFIKRKVPDGPIPHINKSDV